MRMKNYPNKPGFGIIDDKLKYNLSYFIDPYCAGNVFKSKANALLVPKLDLIA